MGLAFALPNFGLIKIPVPSSDPSQVTKFYKKNKKSILINVEDHIVSRSDEQAFILEIEQTDNSCKLILNEVDN